ncbi:MAG: beta-3-deoxy-D-manno-oct-2-ulosonic acid transferase [Pseudomonadota bacterium]
MKPALVIGIKPWKRWQITPFLAPRFAPLQYLRSPAAALREPMLENRILVIWAAREPPGFAEAVMLRGATLIRMEDGFLRSVGLGSNHIGSSSLVVDDVGIYLDPRRPSALELLLQDIVLDADLQQRATALRQLLVQHGLTKYNIGSRMPIVIAAGQNQQRLLVPGQVENDASLRLGSPEVRGNLALLQRVRGAHPEAWIVYKPHPDTEAGTRPGRLSDNQVLLYADQIVRGVSVTALFPHIDAVHTMTSLVGFEALLRGVKVHCWGLPFYAGWGLTSDHLPSPRRRRRLHLDELVAGALIRYPLYLHPDTGLPCEVEDLARHLATQGSADVGQQRSSLRRLGRQSMGVIRAFKATRDAK